MAERLVKLNPPGRDSSPIVNIVLPDVIYAGAADVIKIVPVSLGERETTWELVTACLILTTTVDVGNRYFGLGKYTKEGNEISARLLSAIVAASTSHALQIAGVGFNLNGTIRVPGTLWGIQKILLKTGDYLQYYIETGAFAGDKLSGAMQFRCLGSGRDLADV